MEQRVHPCLPVISSQEYASGRNTSKHTESTPCYSQICTQIRWQISNIARSVGQNLARHMTKTNTSGPRASESHDKNGHIRTKPNDENAFGLLARHPRLVGGWDITSVGKRTQALTDMHSDSLCCFVCPEHYIILHF